MKIYLTYKQLCFEKSMTNNNKKNIFKTLYWKSFKTIWPYIGICALFAILFVGKYVFNITGYWERGLLAGFAGFIYFQFHCFGIETLFQKQKNKTN